MKSFNEFLTEGREAPLYHGSSSYEHILNENQIRAKTYHLQVHLLGTRKSMINRGTIDGDVNLNSGVSLTRNMWVAMTFAGLEFSAYGVVFELDQRKLAQTHKIIPVSFLQAYTHVAARSTHPGQSSSEYEEFVPGGIKPLDRYLVAIWSNDSDHKLKYHPKFRLLASDRFHRSHKNAGAQEKGLWYDELN